MIPGLGLFRFYPISKCISSIFSHPPVKSTLVQGLVPLNSGKNPGTLAMVIAKKTNASFVLSNQLVDTDSEKDWGWESLLSVCSIIFFHQIEFKPFVGLSQ